MATRGRARKAFTPGNTFSGLMRPLVLPVLNQLVLPLLLWPPVLNANTRSSKCPFLLVRVLSLVTDHVTQSRSFQFSLTLANSVTIKTIITNQCKPDDTQDYTQQVVSSLGLWLKK